METIGFSTGSLDRTDVANALRLIQPHGTGAVELSALRIQELGPLLRSAADLPLDTFRHVSVHAPSSFGAEDERAVAAALLPLARRGWLVILHPDTIHDPREWLAFDDRVCIENMDRRKHSGRTVEELRPVFASLPHASFCFDVAHARQCDTSMTEAYRLLEAFSDRLKQVHVSELNGHSHHVRLTPAGIRACNEVAHLIPLAVPVIIEAPVQPGEIGGEIEASLEALGRLAALPCAA